MTRVSLYYVRLNKSLFCPVGEDRGERNLPRAVSVTTVVVTASAVAVAPVAVRSLA
jgi:hypothetical protein